VERVRNDRDLSPAGRKKQITELYEKARADVDANLQADREVQQRARDVAYRRLFGAAAGDQLSLRDALDRARGVSGGPAEFERAMKDAHDRGDEVMVTALAHRAAERMEAAGLPGRRAQWDAVLDEYASTVGRSAELATLRRLTGGDPSTRVAAQMDRRVPRPAEVDQRMVGEDSGDAA
jgi:hypothetical protein